jgi:hypothetical protein
MEPLSPLPFIHPGVSGEWPWWPAKLGTPEAAGGHGDVRFAYFAEEHRLALDVSGTVLVYDTAAHRINGAAEQQADGEALIVFMSQFGTVRPADLPLVDILRPED